MVLFVLKSAFWHFMSSLARGKKTLMHMYLPARWQGSLEILCFKVHYGMRMDKIVCEKFGLTEETAETYLKEIR